MNWNWLWAKTPRPMQRTLADDVKASVFVLLGAALGLLVFGGDVSLLLYMVAGAVLSTAVLNVLRFVKRRRSA
jgi:hypothetical protein